MRDVVCDGKIQRGAVCAGLAAGDDLHHDTVLYYAATEQVRSEPPDPP